MLKNLLIGLPTMALCLFLQGVLIVVIFRYYAHRAQKTPGKSSLWSTLRAINGVMLLLVLVNIAQIVIWAALFLLIDEFSDMNDAIYHSAVNFATLGYGDIVMSREHRLLGPLQAINGVLMIGVSTTTLTAAVRDSMQRLLLRSDE